MNITCYDIDGNLLKTLTQWDINQKIVINNLSLTNTPEVHFCNPHSELALVGELTYSDGTLTTEVPNILLQENLPIIVYIYVTKGDGSAKTTYSIRIPVNPRPKPADYEYSDNAHFITYEELQAALANSVEVIELANSAADRANEAASVAEAFTEYGKNNFANAIKGTERGKTIQIDDVSPIEHIVDVSVRNKNLFDVSKIETNPQKTIVNNGDGTITVKTASNTTSVAAPNATLRDLAPQLKVGKMYTLSANTTGEQSHLYFKIAGISRPNFFWNFGKSAMMTEDLLASNVFFYASGPSTTAIISEIQIEEGETATEYTPYIDPTTVTVTEETTGATYTPNADGTCEIVSVSPTMVLLTNNSELTIDCEYNKDTEKAIKSYVDTPLIDQSYNPKSTNAQSGIAVEEAVKLGDKWELINTIALSQDVSTIMFNKDSDGNPFTLKSFYIKSKIGVTTPTSARLHLTASAAEKGGLNALKSPESVRSLSQSPRTWGCGMHGCFVFFETQSLALTADYPNSNVPNSIVSSIPPYHYFITNGVKRIAISAVKSSIMDFDNIVEGSTFELWGVRK